jgi:hypothetical protein
MAELLGAARRATSDKEMPTAAMIASTYDNISPDDCVPTRDAALMFTDDGMPVGYGRTARGDPRGRGSSRELAVLPGRSSRPPHRRVVHRGHRIDGAPLVLGSAGRSAAGVVPRVLASPRAGPAGGRSVRLAGVVGLRRVPVRGVVGATHLDDIPGVALPDGVAIRPVEQGSGCAADGVLDKGGSVAVLCSAATCLAGLSPRHPRRRVSESKGDPVCSA